MLGARDAERKPRPVGRLHFLESNDIDAHFASLDRQYDRMAARLESVDTVVRQTHADLGELCEQSRDNALRLQVLVELGGGAGGEKAGGEKAGGAEEESPGRDPQTASRMSENPDDGTAAERHAAVLASITGLAYRLDQVTIGAGNESQKTANSSNTIELALQQIQASLSALQTAQQPGRDSQDATIARLEQENAELRQLAAATSHLSSQRTALELEVAELGRQVARRETQLEMLEQAYAKRYRDLEQLAERCSTLQLRIDTTVVDKYRSAVSLAVMALRSAADRSPERPRSPSLLPSRSSWMTPWLPDRQRPVRSTGDEPLRERLSNIPRLSPTKRQVRMASSPLRTTGSPMRVVSSPLLGPPLLGPPLLGPPLDENDL